MKLILFLCISLSLFGMEQVPVYSQNEIFTITVPSGMADHFISTCLKYKVPIKYAYRLIEYESRWDKKAVNWNNDGTTDLGLMQLNSAYMDDFSWRYNNGYEIDPFDWKVAMDVGLRHLSVLHKHTGSWYGAVAAYNMGLKGYKTRKIYSTTQRQLDYVFK